MVQSPTADSTPGVDVRVAPQQQNLRIKRSKATLPPNSLPIDMTATPPEATSPTEESLESLRHAQQLAWLASGANIEVGDSRALPWTVDALAQTRGDEAHVVQRLESGLTAVVFQLRSAGQDWTLKRARPQALVRNLDGQTSFLNEVQRRADLRALKQQPGGQARWAGIVDTAYASFQDGLILSPWIAGQSVRHWDERQLQQLLDTACALWTEGFFEWDLCAGNILDDGQQVYLFDFGYMYRFDPRCQFSSAGNGRNEPLFHPAERFETRNYCATLLQLEYSEGIDAALKAFRTEKAIAIEAYRRMRHSIAARGAQAHVLAWLDGWVQRWSEALKGDLQTLYQQENWRSHVLDLDDDLRGQTCTPMTIKRADWLLWSLQEHFKDLKRSGAFFWGDIGKSQSQLIAQYTAHKHQAQHYQIPSPKRWG